MPAGFVFPGAAARALQSRRRVTPNIKILKAGAPLPEGRIAAAVHDADRRVREMLGSAELEASRIRAEAEAEREVVRARAVEEGRREGHARAAATLALAAAERQRLLASCQREVVTLVLALARKVLGRELAERADAIAELAAQALAEARERRDVVLGVNPADAPAIRAAEGALGAVLVRARLAVREDPGVPRGSVVVDTEAGLLEAGIDAQLEHLGRALEEALAR